MSTVELTEKSAEWYTMPRYIEAVRSVMGSIELDPASCAEANQIVKADRYFTKEQNGLDQEWRAKTVWLNPPYGRTAKMAATRKSTIGLFIEKLLTAYYEGDIEQAIILATTEVNAKWFQPLRNFLICFPDHRVKFIVPVKLERGIYSQMFGTCFVYLGLNEQKFIDEFEQFGDIMKRVSKRKTRTTNAELWEEIKDAPR